jgi:septal ring-binding cell division protein DamX
LAPLSLVLHAETVCVINSDGEGWRCGPEEEISQLQPGRAQRKDSARSLPPPLLIDPARLTRLEYEAAAAGMRSSPPPAEASASSAGMSDPWSSAAPARIVNETLPPTLAVIRPEPGPSTAPAPAPEAAADPVPGAARPAVETPPVAAAPTPAPVAATAPAAGPARPPGTPVLSLNRASSIADWGDREYTLQLAAAASAEGFAAFAGVAGLDPNSLFVIRLGQPEGNWWLLCSGRYPDLQSARRALDALPATARTLGAWPRRIGPLKKDARP